MNSKKLLVILGPTATGKTDLGLKLAEKLGGELIACDSRQVYKGLDIGTGKLPGESENLQIEKRDGFWQVNGVNIWLYDVVDPKIQFTVFDYVIEARQAVEGIENRGKLSIIVGGTGFYLKALISGLDDLRIPTKPALRRKLSGWDLHKLQGRVEELSPTRWAALNCSDRNNPRRLVRILEHIYMYPYINTNFQTTGLDKTHDVLKIGLTAPRPYLNNRIDVRLSARISQGLIREGQMLLRQGVTADRMRELGLEYGLLADLLEGKIGQEEFEPKLRIKIHRFAKRQMTWFEKEPAGVHWFDVSSGDCHYRIEELVRNWYNQKREGKIWSQER